MGAISYSDYIKEKRKLGTKVTLPEGRPTLKGYDTKPSLGVLKKKADLSKEKLKISRDELNSYLTKSKVTTNDKFVGAAPTPFTLRKQTVGLSLDRKNSTVDDEFANMKKYQEVIQTPTGISLSQKTNQLRNENALAESNYNYTKGMEDYKNASNLKRAGMIINSAFRQGARVLRLDNVQTFKDPKTGVLQELPSYIEGIDAGIQEYGSQFAKGVNAVSGQIGKVGASAMLNSIMPFAGTVAYNTELFKSSYNNTLREGYSPQQALSYATLSTATEFATGKLLGASIGKFMKTGDFEKGISDTLRKVLSSEKINKVVSSAISEGSEEFIQEFIDGFERNLVLGEDNDVFSTDTLKNALYSGLIGALSSGASEGIRQSTKNSINSQIDQIVYDIERTNSTTLSELNKAKIANNVMEQYINNEVVNPTKVVDDFNLEIKTKIDALMKSATKEKLDITNEKTRSLMNTLNKLIQDRGYEITFDSNIKDGQRNTANGVNINGNIIKINPNSSRALEFIAMHEVTHSISTKKMRELVMDYAEKHPDLKEQLESVKKTYRTTDISDEVLADVSGQLFGNQEFVKMLKNDEPSTFKKIYNGIVSVANKITGNTKEALFTKNLQNMWENAYRSSDNNSFENEKYHISKDLNTSIDNVLSNIEERNPVKLRDYTPQVLVDNGVKNLPIYENPSHVRKNILTSKEAQSLGLSIMPNDHYHGLGKDLYIKVIDSLDNPRVIFKNKNNNDYLILTTLKDNEGNNIIVPIEIETTSNVNNFKIDINRVKSIYGKENLNNYIKRNINQNKFDKIYEQKKERGTGLIPAASSFLNSNISQSNEDVKSNIFC